MHTHFKPDFLKEKPTLKSSLPSPKIVISNFGGGVRPLHGGGQGGAAAGKVALDGKEDQGGPDNGKADHLARGEGLAVQEDPNEKLNCW